VVSTRDLHGLLVSVAEGRSPAGTLLDDDVRGELPLALAEHFHYPHVPDVRERYAQDIAAAVLGRRKLIVRREGPELYDLSRDPDERAPEPGSVGDFAALCRRDGVSKAALQRAVDHLERWSARSGRPASSRRAEVSPARLRAV
jgi:hypothetical protein